MSTAEQLYTELKRIETAKRTKDACEILAKFARETEGADPLVTKQADNPYLSSPSRGAQPCCVIS